MPVLYTQSCIALLFAMKVSKLAVMCCQGSAIEQGRGEEGNAAPMIAKGCQLRGPQHMFQKHVAVGEESWSLPCLVKSEAACYLHGETQAGHAPWRV